jgi:hypothetical protein
MNEKIDRLAARVLLDALATLAGTLAKRLASDEVLPARVVDQLGTQALRARERLQRLAVKLQAEDRVSSRRET